jgi:hypothetical protein
MPARNFQIIGTISDIEVVAVRHLIRDLDFLQRTYGRGRWRKLKGVARVLLENGRMRLAEVHWYEAHGIGKRQMKIKQYLDWVMKHPKNNEKLIAICVDNTDYEMSLQRRKVYPVLPDADAEKDDYVRIIDETGEDYLFPASRFVFLNVPSRIEEAVLAKV